MLRLMFLIKNTRVYNKWGKPFKIIWYELIQLDPICILEYADMALKLYIFYIQTVNKSPDEKRLVECPSAPRCMKRLLTSETISCKMIRIEPEFNKNANTLV